MFSFRRLLLACLLAGIVLTNNVQAQRRGRGGAPLPEVKFGEEELAPATMRILAPPGTTISIDGTDVGDVREFTYSKFITPTNVKQLKVIAKFADGQTAERQVEIKPGQNIPVPLPLPAVGKPVCAVTQAIPALLALAATEDFGLLVTGDEAGNAIVWDTRLGRPVRALRGHQLAVQSVDISPDGSRVLTGSADGTAILWNTETGRPLLTLRGHAKSILSVSLSVDGKRAATGSLDTTAILWDLTTGEPLHKITQHKLDVSGVAIHPDGSLFATVSLDQTGFLWNTQTGKQEAALTGHSDIIYAVEFSRDGKRLLTGSADNTAILRDSRTGVTQSVSGRHDVDVVDVAMLPDGSRLLTAPRDFTVGVWDTYDRRKLVRSFTTHALDVSALAVSGDGKLVASAARDRSVRLWDLCSGVEVACLASDSTLSNWAVAGPDGLFDASLAGRDLLGYGFAEQRPGVVVRQLSEKFFHPGLLSELVRGERPVSPIPLGVSAPPEVRFANNLPRQTSEPLLDVTVETRDQGAGVANVQLFVNGARFAAVPQVDIAGPVGTHLYRVPLMPGQNEIRAFASTADGTWQAATAPVETEFHAATVRPGRVYVVAVCPEQAALEELRQLAKQLRQNLSRDYSRLDFVEISGSDVTRARISQMLQDLAELAQPGDAMCLLVSGQGEFSNEQWSVRVAGDGSKADQSSRNEIGITEMANWLAGSACTRRMLISDLQLAASASAREELQTRLRRGTEQLAQAQGLLVWSAVRTTNDGKPHSANSWQVLAQALTRARREFANLPSDPVRQTRAVNIAQWWQTARRQPIAESGTSGLLMETSSQATAFDLLSFPVE